MYWMETVNWPGSFPEIERKEFAMIREGSLEEISDGKLYGPNDMVKADCGDCKGCSSCCRGMGSSIVLDPLDVHRLLVGLRTDFSGLLSEAAELHVEEGLILPHLKMAGAQEACAFLDEKGRCRVHAFRPGICRLFPLGRFYENGSFSYFLQIHECRNQNRTKVKVKKWVDTPEFARYEAFVCEWHYFLKAVSQRLSEESEPDGELARQVSMYLLKTFYMTAYAENEDFYGQWKQRMDMAKGLIVQE